MGYGRWGFFITLALCPCWNATGQEKVISTGEEWFYYDAEAPLPTNWYTIKNIEAEWKKGISPLGYGDDIIKTKISYGGDPNNKHITKYFRKAFIVDDPHKYLIYKLKVQRDDGILIYLNGREIMRNNMPNGIITDSTKANSLVFNSSNEVIEYTKLLSPNDLVAGVNTISASVHQARESSSDCLFNLELIGSNDSEVIPLLLKEQTIDNLNLDLKLKELSHKQDLEKSNLQIEYINQTKNIFKVSLIGLLLALVPLALFLFWTIRNSRKKNRELEGNISTLTESNKRKDREMMNLSLNALNSKQFLKEIKRDLEEHHNLPGAKGSLKQISSKIDYNLDYEEEWENLKKHFNEVHIGFVDNLSRRYPSLTDIELRHCIFIKLHMQTKEIANILHIDPRSVQAARYRLKKKMRLDENTDLKEFLLSISENKA